MDKGQLMEYLGAVCDAENALYACNEAIEQLKAERECFVEQEGTGRILDTYWNQKKFKMPQKPKEPEKAKPDIPHVEKKQVKGGCAIIVVGAVVGLIIGALTIGDGPTPSIAGMFIGPLVGALLPIGILDFIERSETQTAREQAQKSAESRAEYEYQRAMEEYKGKLTVYEESKKVAAAIRKEIEDAIQSNTCVAERIKGELQQLYDQNIVHVSFRNMVAINQIREYLDMGICNGLEGPNGAYAQYMLDVRTDRICSSIEELKKSVLMALEKIAMTQSMLVAEIRKTNENLTCIQTSIDQGFANIQQQMNRAQQMAAVQASQLNDRFAEMNGQVVEIREALAASAHNQYVALRETNVRKYLKKYQLDLGELS